MGRGSQPQRLNAKTGGSKCLAHTGWIGGRGIPKEREEDRRERFESVRGECANVKLLERHRC